jgi:hypothetical protein
MILKSCPIPGMGPSGAPAGVILTAGLIFRRHLDVWRAVTE